MYPPPFAVLFDYSPTFRCLLGQVRDCGVVDLGLLHEAAGRPTDHHPRAWVRNAASLIDPDSVADLGRGGIFARSDTAIAYARSLDPLIVDAIEAEAYGMAIANPASFLLQGELSAFKVDFALAALAGQGLPKQEAVRLIVDGCIALTRGWPVHEQETAVARVQRALEASIE